MTINRAVSLQCAFVIKLHSRHFPLKDQLFNNSSLNVVFDYTQSDSPSSSSVPNTYTTTLWV